MPTTYDADRLFPETECIAAVGELSAWTSVQALLAAARYLDGRPEPQDQLEPTLVVPVEDDGVFEAILAKAIEWLIAGYTPPAAKIAPASTLDPLMSKEAAAALISRRFRPNIDRVSGTFVGLPAATCLLVRDDPVVIELIHAPLICMIDLLRRFNESARRMYQVLKEQKQTTGGSSTVFHRHYADSRLPAVLEALCFYCWGLDFGPVWGEAGQGDAEMSYRAVNVHGVPPIDTRLVDAAHHTMETMLASLR